VTRGTRSWPAAAGVVGCLAYVLIGWSGLLVPTLIRSVKVAFDQSDAGMGVFFFVFALGWGGGSLGGGLVTERVGRRTVLSLAAALHGIGLAGLAFAPVWPVFLLAAVPAGLGGGAIDGGGTALFLDLFQSNRGRALNLLHLFFSMGALLAPLAVGRMVEDGVDWHVILLGTGLVALVVAVLFLVVPMPDGRRAVAPADRTGEPRGDDGPVDRRARDRFAAPLLLLALAIGCYVAAEIGVSNWLVRFLEPAPLTVATTGLSLYWAGLTLGRLLSARLSDRFDHRRFTIVAATAMAIALAAAILVPSLPLSIALFGLAGIASGPVFPMIMVIAGDRYPDRSAAVTGFLSGSAVAGSIIYPPVIGFMSVTIGLTIAMLGNVLLGLACAGALVLLGRREASDG
jgi:fucose permease